ncbi:GyrI-like domain-containing protein, partial [Pseudomonas sp. yb_9]
LYRDWLPSSHEELRDHPLFFQYLSVYPETPLEQWETDVYVPLK